MAFSPDGRVFAVASTQGVYLYDAQTLADLRYIETLSSTLQLAFSPDGSRLAAGFTSGEIAIWRTADWEVETTLNGEFALAMQLAFLDQGHSLLVLTASPDDSAVGVRVWGLAERQTTFEQRVYDTFPIALGGDYFAIAEVIYNRDGQVVQYIGAEPNQNALSRDGHWFVTANIYSQQIDLWEVASGRRVYTLAKPPNIVTSSSNYDSLCRRDGPDGLNSNYFNVLQLSANSNLLAVSPYSGRTQLFNVADGTVYGTLDSPAEKIAFAPNDQRVALLLPGGTIEFWEVATQRRLGALMLHISAFNNVAVAPNSQLIAAGGADGRVRVLRARDGALVFNLKEQATSLAFSPSGEALVTGSQQGAIHLWNMATGALLQTLTGHLDQVNRVAFSPGGQLLASASNDCTAGLWRVSDGARIYTATAQLSEAGETDYVSDIAFSSDNQQLVAATYWGHVLVWQKNTGQLVARHYAEFYSSERASLVFSLDGSTLILGSGYSEGIRFFNLNAWGPAQIVVEGTALQLARAPNGQLMASTGVQLFRPTDGEIVRTLPRANSLAFSPDGTFLVTADIEGAVRVWGLRP